MRVALADLTGDDGVFIDGDWVESKDQDPLGDVRLIQLADVGDGIFISKSSRFLTSHKAKELRCTFLEPGDVLIARMPDPIGRACIFPELGQPCVTVVDVCVLRPDPSKVVSRWLLHKINSPGFRRELKGWLTGTTRTRISRGNLSKITFELPPLDEQRRIAAILDKADALRRKRKRAVELLNGLTQSIFLEMFGDRLIGAPKNLSTVADVAELQNGAYFPADRYVGGDGGVEMVHMSDAFCGIVSRGSLKRISASTQEKHKYALLDTDILIARRSLNVEGAAKPCLIPPSAEALIYESSFIRVRPKTNLTARYIYQYMSSSVVRKLFIDKYITQSTISGINQNNLSKIPILIPEKEEQDQLILRLKAVDRAKVVHDCTLECANFLFASLQHRAFTGQL